MDKHYAPIGIFDSGYGGLTVYKEIEALLPQYDYVYLGDNARVPYGNRSFETVLEFTWECVQALFEEGCSLVILACNTASAKALRTIQQKYLPAFPHKKVLGVIRPTTEIASSFTKSNHIGVLGTQGTIKSNSYEIEITKFFPNIKVNQLACPMWVPLVENNEHNYEGADYFVKKYIHQILNQDDQIDAIILACTHYPLLLEKIQKILPKPISLISQGELVAKSLQEYLTRHDEVRQMLSTNTSHRFLTTDDTFDFNNKAKIFLGRKIESEHLDLS